MRLFEGNAPLSRKRAKTSSNEEVNEAMFCWFKLARQQNIPVSGPMLQEEIKIVAEKQRTLISRHQMVGFLAS